MKVLVTGAKGFVGKNLCESLKAIRDGKDKREKFKDLLPLTVFEYDKNNSLDDLDEYCAQADFVFNLAGINRSKDSSEYMKGNFEFGEKLLDFLIKHGNSAPVMLASSIQASLDGRYSGSLYGESKLAGEELLFDYSEKTGSKVLVYRFPNLYGKWCRPNYNSVVATFCDAIANGRDFHVDDPNTELDLLYIDDLIAALLDALLGKEEHCRCAGAECVPSEKGRYCYALGSQKATLGEIVSLLEKFQDSRNSAVLADFIEGSFEKKLYSTFLSYYEMGSFSYSLNPKEDDRGSFTEFLKTSSQGQVSINISKPGVTKGNHWHHSKWEKFLVVSGKALIRLRKVGTDKNGNSYPVDEYYVSGDDLQVVEMIPGMTHSITNLSDSENLVTVMWANEAFNPNDPDTFYEEV